MTGFVYKWTNQINGKWYIGSHKGTIDDGYRHSSKIMLIAEEKYGIDVFTREILFEGDYEKDDIRKIESEYLNKYNAAHNPSSYNRSNITGTSCVSKNSRMKMAAAWTDERKAKHIERLRGKSYIEIYGKELGTILAQARRDNRTGRICSDKTKVLMRIAKLGIVQSEDHKRKRSEAMKKYWDKRRVD